MNVGCNTYIYLTQGCVGACLEISSRQMKSLEKFQKFVFIVVPSFYFPPNTPFARKTFLQRR